RMAPDFAANYRANLRNRTLCVGPQHRRLQGFLERVLALGQVRPRFLRIRALRFRRLELRQQEFRVGALQGPAVGVLRRRRVHDRRRDPAQIFALQVAPERRDVAAGLELAPDGVLQRVVKLGQAECLTILRLTISAFLDARGHRVGEELIEQPALYAQHPVGQRNVRRDRTLPRVFSPAVELVDGKPAHEFGTQPEAVDRQQAVGDQLQRGTLLVRCLRRERIAPAGGMVAYLDDAADILGRHGAGVAELRQAGDEIAPQHFVALPGLELAVLQPRPELAGELQAAGGEFERIAAPIAAAYPA